MAQVEAAVIRGWHATAPYLQGFGEAVTVAPMDTETSVEAALLAKLATSGVSLQEGNASDLRERSNLNVALAVKAS